MWRPPMWGNGLGAWELNDPANSTSSQVLAHSSRRTWDLSFSYLDKTKSFPEYGALNKLQDNDITNDTGQTLMTSTDFFSRVWNIVGNSIPFIFQPDSTANDFAIAKFDMKSIKFDQVANQVYNIKLKIREAW